MEYLTKHIYKFYRKSVVAGVFELFAVTQFQILTNLIVYSQSIFACFHFV